MPYVQSLLAEKITSLPDQTVEQNVLLWCIPSLLPVGIEIDFVIEKDGKITFVEAKHSERPDNRKFNFHKISPLFNTEIKKMLACSIKESGLSSMKDYSIYNPLYGKIYL